MSANGHTENTNVEAVSTLFRPLYCLADCPHLRAQRERADRWRSVAENLAQELRSRAAPAIEQGLVPDFTAEDALCYFEHLYQQRRLVENEMRSSR